MRRNHLRLFLLPLACHLRISPCAPLESLDPRISTNVCLQDVWGNAELVMSDEECNAIAHAAARLWDEIHDLVYRFVVCLEGCAERRISSWQKDGVGENWAAPVCNCEYRFLLQLFVLVGLENSSMFGRKWLKRTWLLSERQQREQSNHTRLPHRPPEELRQALALLEYALVWPSPSEQKNDKAIPQTWDVKHKFLKMHRRLSDHMQRLRAESTHHAMQSHDKKYAAAAGLKVAGLKVPDEASPVVHIMLVIVSVPGTDGGKDRFFGQKAFATIRSALHFAHRWPLHFHLVVDTSAEAQIKQALRSNLEAHLLLRAAAFMYYDAQVIRKLITERFGTQCVENVRFGAIEAFARLIPHEVFGVDHGYMICAEAADFVFLSDPAELLDAHVKATASVGVASYTAEAPFFIQVFSLHLMHAVGWSAKVDDIFSGSDNVPHLCETAEARCLSTMAMMHPELFVEISPMWAHVPWVDMKYDGVHPLIAYTSVSDRHGAHFVVNPCGLDVWNRREHPGLIDNTHIIIHHPGFAEAFFGHLVTQGSGKFLPRAGHVSQSLKEAQKLWRNRLVHQGRIQVFAVHFTRQFHNCVPWSLRFLDFWSRSSANSRAIAKQRNPWMLGCSPLKDYLDGLIGQKRKHLHLQVEELAQRELASLYRVVQKKSVAMCINATDP